MQLSNNTILITGGTSGIGLTLGRALLKLNNVVLILGRDKDRLLAAEKEGFEVVSCDLGSQQDIELAALYIRNHFPKVNMLFNNAGVQFNYDFTEGIIPLRKITDEININLTGQLMLTHLLIPLLSNADRSVIVNTTSGLGAFPKNDGLIYSASKAAMRNFTVGLRYRLKDFGINVLEFIPPVTDTGMTKNRNGHKMAKEKLVQYILPQLQREQKILTTRKIRFFLWVAFLFPSLAHKLLSS